MTYDAIILGAGAAGLMCAARAGQRGRCVLLIDHADGPGKKIVISGGGRCNFTNTGTAADRFVSANPHFARSSLERYTALDFVALVERYGIAWHEKTLGQLFCDGSARQIVAMLLAECPDTVTLRLGMSVGEVRHADGRFAVTIGGRTETAPALVVATGGPSIPKMGATGLAYDLARQFGVKVVEPAPALVPLTLGGDEILFRELSGVAAPTRVRCGKTVFEEASLFTHRGLSGPAILQISSYWRHGTPITVDFLPAQDAAVSLRTAKRDRPRATLRRVLEEALPARLADALSRHLSAETALLGFSDAALGKIGGRLSNWAFHPTGTEGFAKAEVTRGGIDTRALSQRTMEVARVPGLYFIGEAVDVTG